MANHEEGIRIPNSITLASLIETAMFGPTPCSTLRELATRLAARDKLDPKVWCSESSLWDRAPFT